MAARTRPWAVFSGRCAEPAIRVLAAAGGGCCKCPAFRRSFTTAADPRPPAWLSRSLTPPRAPRLPAAQTFLDRKEVTERVLSVLKNFEKVDPAKVTPSAHFANDLGLDSLDAVEVRLAVRLAPLHREYALNDCAARVCHTPTARSPPLAPPPATGVHGARGGVHHCNSRC